MEYPVIENENDQRHRKRPIKAAIAIIVLLWSLSSLQSAPKERINNLQQQQQQHQLKRNESITCNSNNNNTNWKSVHHGFLQRMLPWPVSKPSIAVGLIRARKGNVANQVEHPFFMLLPQVELQFYSVMHPQHPLPSTVDERNLPLSSGIRGMVSFSAHHNSFSIDAGR